MPANRELVIAVDVDEVCADLLGAWLAVYNDRFGTSFLPEDIEGWDLAETVKPKSREDLYGILNGSWLYSKVLPIVGARKAVRALNAAGHRVLFVTTCIPGTEQAKFEWLVRHGFLETGQRRNFLSVSDKSLVRADVLFDDKPQNVEEFPGIGVLVRCPHNRDSRHPYSVGSLAEAPMWLHSFRNLVNGKVS